MSDDAKQTIERYVDSALKKRIAEAASAAGQARTEILAAIERLELEFRSLDTHFDLPGELIPVAPTPPPAAEVGLLGHVFSAQQELVAATDQVGLLTQLLLGCTVSCSRVAFFILKKDALAGWAARGFDRAQDSDVRSLSIPVSDDTILGAACRSGATIRSRPGKHAQDGRFLSRLGGGLPTEAMAVPIWIRDKVAAVLYGDSGKDEQILDPEVPEILGIHAGLCLETLATRQKSPRPKTGGAHPPSSPPAQTSSMEAPSAVSIPGPISLAGSGGATPGGPAPSPGSSYTPAAAPSSVPASASVQRPPIAPAPLTPPAIPSPTLSSSGAQRAAAPSMAPPPLDEVPEDERKFHEEARRFARLLVSEIVLYNERQVDEGRRQKDLYERLREDIDRSRGMYEQRVNAKVRTVTNYFYQELVRTLANGDESAIKVPWA
jgi:hypothetical protein